MMAPAAPCGRECGGEQQAAPVCSLKERDGVECALTVLLYEVRYEVPKQMHAWGTLRQPGYLYITGYKTGFTSPAMIPTCAELKLSFTARKDLFLATPERQP